MTTSAETPLRAVGVGMTYGDAPVIEGITMDFQAGRIYALTGANGTGKSTLMAILAGVERPSVGHVIRPRTVSGVTRSVGYVAQASSFYPTLSVSANLVTFARLAGLRAAEIETKIDESLHIFGLAHRRDVRARDLSGGQQRRLHVAMCTVAEHPVLLLDEPTAGADHESQEVILSFLTAQSDKGTCVIFCTHDSRESALTRATVVELVWTPTGSVLSRGSA